MISARVLILFLGVFILTFQSFGQDHPYFMQTEAGILLGDSEYESNEIFDRKGFTFHTFHGVHLTSKHVLGFSLGVDRYQNFTVVPIAVGWRGFLGKKENSKLFLAMDIGAGGPVSEEAFESEWQEYRYNAGLMLNPSVGFRFPSRKGKTALSISLGYKQQNFSFFWGEKSRAITQTGISSSGSIVPSGYNSYSKTKYLYHNLSLRMGIML